MDDLFGVTELVKQLDMADEERARGATTIGEEKQKNPRVAGRTREQYIDVMNNLGLPLPEKIQEGLQPNQSALDEPHVAIVKALLLEFQPTFLDILPVYIVMLAIFPAVLLGLRRRPELVLVPSALRRRLPAGCSGVDPVASLPDRTQRQPRKQRVLTPVVVRSGDL